MVYIWVRNKDKTVIKQTLIRFQLNKIVIQNY